MHVDVPLTELFAHPVLRDLAARAADASTAEAQPIPVAVRGGPLALSLAQQRLWFVSQFEGVSRAYHISGGLRLQGPLDRTALARALARIAERHETLRTRFVQVDGQPVQAIEPAGHGLPLPEGPLGLGIDSVEWRELVERESAVEFDLEQGPLVRVRLVVLGERDHVLLMTMHHIVSDGWSMGVFVNELSALYAAFLEGRPDPLPPLAIQYADYASWQRQWLAGERQQSNRNTGGRRWRERRRAWSCRATGRGRRSRTTRGTASRYGSTRS